MDCENENCEFFAFFTKAQNDKVRRHCEQGKCLAWQSINLARNL